MKSQNVTFHDYLFEVDSKSHVNRHYGCDALYFVFPDVTWWNNFVEVKINESKKENLTSSIREITRPRQQRQRERLWTKELMSRTMDVHVHYNSLYISLSSSAKQQRVMTKFFVIWRTWTTTANFWNFISNLSMCSGLSLTIVLTVINKVNDFRVSRDS